MPRCLPASSSVLGDEEGISVVSIQPSFLVNRRPTLPRLIFLWFGISLHQFTDTVANIQIQKTFRGIGLFVLLDSNLTDEQT